MRPGLKRPLAARAQRASHEITRLVVDVGDYADAWREASNHAKLAYRAWLSAGRDGRRSASLAYLDAIDGEERAAINYQQAWTACCSAS